jgi:hypothetical protein
MKPAENKGWSMSKYNLKTSTPIEVHFGEKTHLQHAFH